MVTDRSQVPPIHPRVLVFWSRAQFLHQLPHPVTSIRLQGLMNWSRWTGPLWDPNSHSNSTKIPWKFHVRSTPILVSTLSQIPTVTRIVQKFPENSPPCSQHPITGTYPQPNSNSHSNSTKIPRKFHVRSTPSLVPTLSQIPSHSNSTKIPWKFHVRSAPSLVPTLSQIPTVTRIVQKFPENSMFAAPHHWYLPSAKFQQSLE